MPKTRAVRRRVVYHDVPPRSPEWHEFHAGRITGTNAAALFASGRKKDSRGLDFDRLVARVAVERWIGRRMFVPEFDTAWTRRGRELEPDARARYEAVTGSIVRPCGFIELVDHRFGRGSALCGTSPDGLVGDDGLIEIKCLMGTNHLAILLSGEIPREHRAQCGHGLMVSGRKWCDFVAYSPEFAPPLDLSIVRLHADRYEMDDHAAHVDAAAAAVAGVLRQLDQLTDRATGKLPTPISDMLAAAGGL